MRGTLLLLFLNFGPILRLRLRMTRLYLTYTVMSRYRPPSQLQRTLPSTDPLTRHETGHETEQETGPVPQRPKLQHAATTPAESEARMNGASLVPSVPTIPECPSESVSESPSESAANSPTHSPPPPPYQFTPTPSDAKCESMQDGMVKEQDGDGDELMEGTTGVGMGTPLVGNLFLSSCPGKKGVFCLVISLLPRHALFLTSINH